MFGNLDTINQEVRKTKYCHQHWLKSIKTIFSPTVGKIKSRLQTELEQNNERLTMYIVYGG
jgi:hypothetical protein